MREFILSKVARKRPPLYVCLLYNIAKSIVELIEFIKYFPKTSFTKQFLELFLIFHWESFLGGMEPCTLIYLLWIHSLT